MLIKWVNVQDLLVITMMLTGLQIDTSNITNAFVSGMKEDLNLYQNQYNYIIVSWTVGYIIGQWVSMLQSKLKLMLTPDDSHQTSY